MTRVLVMLELVQEAEALLARIWLCRRAVLLFSKASSIAVRHGQARHRNRRRKQSRGQERCRLWVLASHGRQKMPRSRSVLRQSA